MRIDNEEDRASQREFKRARVLAAEQHVIREQTNSVATQLRLFSENKAAYVSTFGGEEAYNRAIVGLLQSFPNPSCRFATLRGSKATYDQGESTSHEDDGSLPSENSTDE